MLLVFALIYHIWANWGLVTIHASKMPLGQVIASMERQAHAKIQTDLPSDTPVDMNVVKVHLTDALETLSVVTESRWRLLYFAAGDKSTLKAGEDAWFGGQTPEGWKMVSFPMGQAFALTDSAEDEAPPDPRTNIWTPKTAAPAQIQAFFTDAAALTDAGFAFPTDWNPTVNSAPAAATVDHAIPKLVSSAGGREDAVFFLSKAGPRGPAGGGGEGPAMGADMDLMDEHVQAEITRLPSEEKAEAQSNYSHPAGVLYQPCLDAGRSAHGGSHGAYAGPRLPADDDGPHGRSRRANEPRPADAAHAELRGPQDDRDGRVPLGPNDTPHVPPQSPGGAPPRDLPSSSCSWLSRSSRSSRVCCSRRSAPQNRGATVSPARRISRRSGSPRSSTCRTIIPSTPASSRSRTARSTRAYPQYNPYSSMVAAFSNYGITQKTTQCPSDLKQPNPPGSSYGLYGSSYDWRPTLDDENQNEPLIYGRRMGFGAQVSGTTSSGQAVFVAKLSKIRQAYDDTPIHFGHSNALYADGHVVSFTGATH